MILAENRIFLLYSGVDKCDRRDRDQNTLTQFIFLHPPCLINSLKLNKILLCELIIRLKFANKTIQKQISHHCNNERHEVTVAPSWSGWVSLSADSRFQGRDVTPTEPIRVWPSAHARSTFYVIRPQQNQNFHFNFTNPFLHYYVEVVKINYTFL